MAGGIFTSQNKIRPGAYINFKAVKKTSLTVGTRGVAVIAVPMSWGPEEEFIKISSSDILDGKALNKIGYYGIDKEALIFREALRNCHTLLAYRLKGSNSVKASKTEGPLTVTAKYPGIVGNDITVSVVDTKVDSNFKVNTFLRSELMDTQTVKEIDSLVENDWVTFSGTGAPTEHAGFPLENGVNGSVENSAYSELFNKIKSKNFNTLGLPYLTDEATKSSATTIVKELRDKGKKVQVVLDDYSKANYEGVISTAGQGYKTETEEVQKEGFVSFLTGLTAGTEVNKSNTYFMLDHAVTIINELSDEKIEEALKSGQIVLSYRIDERVIIERDINTLTSYREDTNESFSKNRVIRVLDEINNTIATTYQVNYVGKVDNNEAGRDAFRVDVISYLTSLQSINAIKDFSSDDVEVLAGNDSDSIICNIAITPVDAMEKLYMTVTVN